LGGKKVEGRLLLHIKVHPANIHDAIAGGRVVAETKTKYPTVKGIVGGAGFRGTFKKAPEAILVNLILALEFSAKRTPHKSAAPAAATGL